MEQHKLSVTELQYQETEQLKYQLRMRDQLVDQLSSQLFQMVQEHPPALPQARSPFSMGTSTSKSEELQALEQQISFYQDQIDQRDQQIATLKASCQDLSDRNQMLENVIQELPEVYRQQFAEKLEQFKDKLQVLKTENQRLKSELGYTPQPTRPRKKTVSSLPEKKCSSFILRVAQLSNCNILLKDFTEKS